VRDAQGERAGFVAVSRDITDRKKAEDRLRRTNSLFLSLGVDFFENIEKIILAARDILGGMLAVYGRVEKGRLSILSTVQGEDGLIVTDRPEDYICYEIISRDAEEPLVIEDLQVTEYREKDLLVAKHSPGSFAACPVKRKNKANGCLGLFFKYSKEITPDEIDILGILARALSMEEERLEREEGLKDFIDIASHELRHPITIMKGYAVSLRDQWERLDDELREEMFTSIDRGADRLDGVLRELLDVSRIERGRFELNRRYVSLASITERAVSEMLEKNIERRISLSIPEDIGDMNVDPERFVELLIILLDNAEKYSLPGSDIGVEVEKRGEETVVSVLDEGEGVPWRDRNRIFERFYQVEEARHHSKPGMGLGLYIAREIVEAHGGRIWYEPREGGGSAFRFTLQ
jgi:signal transduction histidine kinase